MKLFSLFEIMFIIAMLALLAALALPKIFKPHTRAAHPPRCKGLKRTWRAIQLMPIGLHRLMQWIPGRQFQPRVEFANIGEGTHEHGQKSYIPDGATAARYLLYKIGTDGDHCAVCGAGDTPLGVSDDLADSNNLDIPIAIKLLGVYPGTVRMVTDGTINNGDHVKAAANGQVTQAASTNRSFGIAIIGTEQTKAAGDVIEVIHCTPQLYVF